MFLKSGYRAARGLSRADLCGKTAFRNAWKYIFAEETRVPLLKIQVLDAILKWTNPLLERTIMKFLKRMLCMLLAAVLLVGGIAVFAAPSLTIAAVNDAFLPLSAAYMPTRIGGEYFVPYGVFSSGGLGVRASYDGSQQMLVMSGGSRTLTYLIAQGYVYDQNMKSYDTPAYSLNGQIYVPVRTICSVFGLSYSLIQSTSAQILRICGSGASQSDSAFLNANKARLSELVDAYNGNPPAVEPVQQPEEQQHKPSLVYLTFFNCPGVHTHEILDILNESGRKATFFLSLGQETDPALLRRIVGEGHAVGLAVNASKITPEALVESANRANALLLEETGMTTRIVTPLGGSEAMTGGQLEALIGAGYRLWDTTLDSRDHELSSYRAANTVTTAFSRTDSPVVVRFRDRDATVPALRTVLGYMRTNGITSAGVSVLRAPINARGDVR